MRTYVSSKRLNPVGGCYALPKDRTGERTFFDSESGKEFVVMWCGADGGLLDGRPTQAPDPRRVGRIHGTGPR